MKKSERFGFWRPASGAILVGALAFAVGAYAAPRPADDARNTGKDTNTVRSDAAQLVTGSPEQVQSVVAGTPPTAVIQIVPIPARVGSYPAGTSIVGNQLKATAGGFRAWFQMQVGDWDPNGDGTTPEHPGTVQCKLDGMGYTSGVGAALVRAQPACANAAACVTEFGDSYAKCELGLCKDAYADKAGIEPQSYCSNFGPGPCNNADCSTTSANLTCFALTEGPRPDDGIFKSFAQVVLDIPAGAKGLYTIPLLVDETFLASSTAPPEDIQTLAEIGFEVNIVTGKCCSQLGSPNATCESGLLQSECGDDEIPPALWTEGVDCTVEGSGEDCAECVNDGMCNDNDACTTESCLTAQGLCQRGIVGGWDQGTQCCEGSGAAPVFTTIDDGDTCTADSCVNSSPNSHPASQETGTATHTPAVAPCNDNNPCTVGDTCDGVNSEANGGCQGSDVNAIPCTTSADCPLDPLGVPFACTEGFCFCTLTPNVRFELDGPGKTCVGGFNDGGACGADADCPGGGVCDNHADGANCYDDGSKFNARVHMGSAGSPINGGQFLITYDPACVKLNSIGGVPPYGTTVYGPVYGNGTVFIAVGVDPFAGINGPLGNTDILALSFDKVGDCNECDLCFASNNPQNTYLVDDEGQRVDIEGKCKSLRGDGELSLDVPGNVKTNVDCDRPTAVVTWDAPSASFSCGTASLSCRGATEAGAVIDSAKVLNGGEFAQGANSFCCYAAANDPCDAAVGCPGAANDCAQGLDGKPVGCWTVTVNDETSLDVDVQLEPPINHTDAGGELTRCIKFCLWDDCGTLPLCFEEDVTFGGLYNFTGKAGSKVKIPGKGQWDCMSAQDQLHTLRSCCGTADGCMYCDGSQLVASFEGDPELGGNWLIGGALDGWKGKDDPTVTQYTIDINDWGTFMSQYGTVYDDNDTGCGTEGPNADINGDGVAGLSDYLFILRNFLVSAKECCCVGQSAGWAEPITEISVDELRRQGRGDLAVADLNGDGLVNTDDMDAFMQGARPSKPEGGRGGKGLRSGR